MHDRPAQYVRNHDGDSVTMVLDQGFYDTKQINIRLANVWAPEEDEDGYVPVKYFVSDWFARHLVRATSRWPFIVYTHRTSKGTEVKTFDRYVANIETVDGKHNLNSDVMHFIVEQGYTGGTGAPVRA